MKNTTYNIQHTTYNEGFSLIELMVTTSIIAIISSIILFNFPSFASRILLENLTHEIALVVRQAQVYGIGIKQAPAAFGSGFPSYGAHFSTAINPPGDPANKKVIFFADLNEDKLYDVGEELETFAIQRGNKVSGICYDSPCQSIGVVDITFKRPEPEAHIYANGAERSSARITVSSPNAEIGDRFITVYSSGQIAVTAE